MQSPCTNPFHPIQTHIQTHFIPYKPISSIQTHIQTHFTPYKPIFKPIPPYTNPCQPLQTHSTLTNPTDLSLVQVQHSSPNVVYGVWTDVIGIWCAGCADVWVDGVWCGYIHGCFGINVLGYEVVETNVISSCCNINCYVSDT